MPFSTKERTCILSTPLGEDELLIAEFEGSERLSQPFHFHLTMQSERDNIAPDELVGKRVTLRIETADTERHWTGMVSTFTRLATQRAAGSSNDTLTTYRCEVVPWLWMLLLNEDSRIYQNLSIPDIVEKIFADFQFKGYELQLTGSYEPLVYCTQYRETTFAFIARLLERAGIWYWFRHEPETETLVLTDNVDGSPELETSRIRFGLHGSYQEGDTVATFNRRELIRSGRIVMRSYDFEKPTADLDVSVDSLVRIGDNGNFERYLHPGGYIERDAGDASARLLMEAEEANHATLDGASDARLMTPGYSFELEEHPDDELNRKYLIVAVEHTGANNLGGTGATSRYTNTFAAIPHDVPYRESPRTPKPRIDGIQTAIVTGPAGEETYTDEYGRVKIHLMWDRWGSTDDKASCWSRVMQGWAGNGWGSFVLPRIGMEVVVAFENGDPDYPLVIGCVYNGANKPPYPLPGDATKSTFKTNSSKGGGGFNELRFEDKKGDEEIFLHAEKDLQVRVKNDSTEAIEHDRNLKVKNDRIQNIDGADDTKVGKTRKVSIDADDNLDVSKNLLVQSGSNYGLTVGTTAKTKAGTELHLKAGMKMVFEAGMQISIKAGPSSITLGPAGVTVDGPLVQLNCGGSPLSAEAPDKPEAAKQAQDAIDAQAGKVSDPVQQAQAKALRNAAAAAQPFCAVCEAARAALAAMGAS